MSGPTPPSWLSPPTCKEKPRAVYVPPQDALFVTFARDGQKREEAIRYLAVTGPFHASSGGRIEEPPQNEPEKTAAFMRMLDMDGRDTTEEYRFLLFADLDVAIEDAYRAARWRALDFIWGKNQADDPAARCPRDFDAPSEAEARARMVAAFGFDFAPRDYEELAA